MVIIMIISFAPRPPARRIELPALNNSSRDPSHCAACSDPPVQRRSEFVDGSGNRQLYGSPLPCPLPLSPSLVRAAHDKRDGFGGDRLCLECREREGGGHARQAQRAAEAFGGGCADSCLRVAPIMKGAFKWSL